MIFNRGKKSRRRRRDENGRKKGSSRMRVSRPFKVSDSMDKVLDLEGLESSHEILDGTLRKGDD